MPKIADKKKIVNLVMKIIFKEIIFFISKMGSESSSSSEIDYNKYGKNYNKKDFNSKVDSDKTKIGVKPIYYAFLLYYAIPRVSLADKVIIIGCLGYLISPFDLIPDFIPVIGYTDDAAVLAWAAYRIGARVDDEVKEKAKKKVMSIFALTEEQINRILNN